MCSHEAAARCYTFARDLTSKAGRTLSYTDTLHVHAVGAAGSDWFKYDPNGNMTTRKVGANTFTLAYDQESRLTGVTGPTSATFVYDGDGRRVKGTTTPGTTYYVGDYYERDSTGTARTYYSIGGQRVAMYDGSQAQVRYLLGDHLSSTSVTASTSATKVAELLYKAWGETRYTSGTTPTTHRFTGQQEESSIGLYFYQARWYDPALGRFAQADTIIPKPGDPQGLNRYTYANNDPLKYVDPDGHWALAGLLIGAGAGFLYGYGSQVLANLQDGNMSLIDALRTNIDTDKVARSTLVGAIAGTGLGMVADMAALGVLPTIGLSGTGGAAAAATAQGGFGTLRRAADFGIWAYRTLAQDIKGLGLQVHHIIEERFAFGFNLKGSDMASVALTAQEHQAFTDAWRARIGYEGSRAAITTLTATRMDVWKAAIEIYANHPALLKAAWLTLWANHPNPPVPCPP